jgi:hypothetical protein
MISLVRRSPSGKDEHEVDGGRAQHLDRAGSLGDIAVMLAEPWLQDAPRMTTLVRRRAGLRALCNAARGFAGMTRKRGIFGAHGGVAGRQDGQFAAGAAER